MYQSHLHGLASDLSKPAVKRLNEDLNAIFHGEKPRPFGVSPPYIGDYKNIVPHTDYYKATIRLKKACMASARNSDTGSLKGKAALRIPRRRSRYTFGSRRVKGMNKAGYE